MTKNIKAGAEESELNKEVRKFFPKDLDVGLVEFSGAEDRPVLRAEYEANMCPCPTCTTDPICTCGSLGVNGPCSTCVPDCVCSDADYYHPCPCDTCASQDIV